MIPFFQIFNFYLQIGQTGSAMVCSIHFSMQSLWYICLHFIIYRRSIYGMCSDTGNKAYCLESSSRQMQHVEDSCGHSQDINCLSTIYFFLYPIEFCEYWCESLKLEMRTVITEPGPSIIWIRRLTSVLSFKFMWMSLT